MTLRALAKSCRPSSAAASAPAAITGASGECQFAAAVDSSRPARDRDHAGELPSPERAVRTSSSPLPNARHQASTQPGRVHGADPVRSASASHSSASPGSIGIASYPRPVRVLVPDDDFTAVLAAVRALRKGGYEPWLAMSVPSAYAARSRDTAGTVPIPDAGPDPEGFVAALAEAAGRLGVAAVLPGTETTLTALAGREADFPDGVVLGVPPREVVERAVDKSLLAELSAQAGLKVPETRVVDSSGVDGIAYPAVVKPVTSSRSGRRRRSSSAGCGRSTSAADLRAALDGMPGESVLVQPFLDGALSAACGVFWDGRIVCVEHQVARRIWPPTIGVSSYAETVPRDPGARGADRGAARRDRLAAASSSSSSSGGPTATTSST